MTHISEHCELGDLAFVKTQHIANKQQVPEERVWYVLKQISFALAYLHEGMGTPAFGSKWKPIWHRDVKLGNIFLAKPLASSGKFVEWEPKLGDFDSAKYQYECPHDEPLDAANDVYRLGATIHMLCTGRHPRMTYEMNERMHDLGLLEQRAERPAPTETCRDPKQKDPFDDSEEECWNEPEEKEYCNVAIPVSTPNEELIKLGPRHWRRRISPTTLEELLTPLAQRPDKKGRISALKLHRVATTFYNCAAHKARLESPDSVSQFQDKFARVIKEWGPEEVLMMTADKSHQKDKKRRREDTMDSDDDEDG